MHKPNIQYTLDIFSHLTRDIPPLTPEIIKKDVKQAVEQLNNNYDLSLEELEKTIIIFGKKLWAYRKAFEEFFDIYESKFGEKFLLGALSQELKKRYKEFREYGGNFRDLHSGNPADFFKSEERVVLCDRLIKVNEDIKIHTVQAVVTTDRIDYEKRIVEFQIILDDIEKRLDSLRIMADDEQGHPELAREIREQILSFEYGLCLLGPPHHYEAICNAKEHFVGRKYESKFHFSI